jgi:hypothetical protein
LANVEREKRASEIEEETLRAKQRVTGVLDPVTRNLTSFQNAQDFSARIYNIFEIITENGKHLNSNGSFNKQQFHGMMNNELSQYIFRGLCNALKESDSESFKQLTLMLKMVEKNVQTSIAEIGLQKSISKTGGVSVRAGDFGETGGGGAGDFRKSGHCL